MLMITSPPVIQILTITLEVISRIFNYHEYNIIGDSGAFHKGGRGSKGIGE